MSARRGGRKLGPWLALSLLVSAGCGAAASPSNGASASGAADTAGGAGGASRNEREAQSAATTASPTVQPSGPRESEEGRMGSRGGSGPPGGSAPNSSGTTSSSGTGAGTTSGGGGSGSAPPRTVGAGSSDPNADRAEAVSQGASTNECQSDRDCACGVDRRTQACSVGPASRVDSTRQCPDFCTGIDGRLRTICEAGRCRQTR